MRFARYLLSLALVSSLAIASDKPDGDALLGAGVRSRPKYDGSDRTKTDAVPVLSYFHGPLFARTTYGVLEGGARMDVAPRVAAGVQIAYEAGPLDEDAGASLGAHVEWTANLGPAPLDLLARFRNHTDSDRGRELDARVTMGIYEGGGLRAGVFGQATWASEKHFLSYYGVRDSGLLYTSIGVLGSYDLGRRWVGVASAEVRRLADEPARSAFVQDRTNSYVTVGVAYRF